MTQQLDKLHRYTRPTLSKIRIILHELQRHQLKNYPGHVLVFFEPPKKYQAIKENELNEHLRRAPACCYLVPSNQWLAHLLSLSITQEAEVLNHAAIRSGDWARMEYFKQFKEVCDAPPTAPFDYMHGDHHVLAALLGRHDEYLTRALTAELKPRAIEDAAAEWLDQKKDELLKLAVERSLQAIRTGGQGTHRLTSIPIPPVRGYRIGEDTQVPLTPVQVSDSLHMIGVAIASNRKALGLSIEELAQETGLNTATLKQIEQGNSDELQSTLCAVAVVRGFFRRRHENAAAPEENPVEFTRNTKIIASTYDRLHASVYSRATGISAAR